jgi:DHA1 family bicyclomycin/chloramphenicol resistance-like MFS transporter
MKRAALWIPVILAGLSMLGPFSIDTPFPAFPEMGRDLPATTEQLQWVVSAYLIAFGLVSPFHGPLSDALGRRPVMIGGVLVFALASVGAALSPNLETLLVFRVLQGLSAGGGVIVSRTVIRDEFEGAEAQRLMSRVMMIFGIAPAVAPVLGGLLIQVGPWQVVFWFMAVFGLLLAAVVLTWLGETHPPELRIPLRVGALLGSLVGVTRSLAFHRVAWSAALSFAGQFLYIGMAPIVVHDLLGLGELDYWILFVPMIAGILVGAQVSSRAAGRIDGRDLVTGALLFSVFGGVVNLVLASLPIEADLPWAVIGPALIAVGTASAYPTLQLLLLDMFPATRGAAVSMFTFFTLILNGVAASALAPIVTESLTVMAAASTALVVAGLVSWSTHLLAVPRERVGP